MSNMHKSDCVVCGKPVTTHKYAQIIPLRPAVEGEKPDVKIEREDDDDLNLKVPHPTEDHRIDGKRFVCLSHGADEAVAALDLEDDIVYEFRHRPARHVSLVPTDAIESWDQQTKVVELTDGRRAAMLGISGGKAEIDFGVLQKCRVFGRQSQSILETWAAELTSR